ncbi:uncharacterized protein LOC144446426 [Glandiceps talaboti]
MEYNEKYRLRKNRAALVATMDVRYVLDTLVANFVFDIDDDERVRAATTSRDKAAMLLNLLEKSKSCFAYKTFREALREPYPHLVEMLDKTQISENDHLRTSTQTTTSPKQKTRPIQESLAVQPVRRKEDQQLVRRAPPSGGHDCTDGGGRGTTNMMSSTSATYNQNVAKIRGRGNFVIMGSSGVTVNFNRN